MTAGVDYPGCWEYGTRVKWTRSTLSHFPMEIGEGVLYLVWFGVAEVWNVRLDDGAIVHLYPELGDAMEKADAPH